MKNQNIVVIAIASALAFALTAVTQAAPCPQSGCGQQLPEITIHSAGNILRGQTGSFVLSTTSALPGSGASGASGMYVNFKVGGTAVAGVDYLPLLSPTFMAQSGYGVISVKTLADPRASSNNQAYTVEVTLEPGAGYAVGQPSSAKLLISTNCVLQACW